MQNRRLEDRIVSEQRQNVRAAIFDHTPKGEPLILLLLLFKSSDNSTYWGLPGGQVEAGETPYAAINRELKEEIAPHLPIVLPTLYLSSEFNTIAEGREVHTSMTMYYARGDSNIDILSGPKEKSILGYDWFPFSSALNVLKYAEQKTGVWKLNRKAKTENMSSEHSKIAFFPPSRIARPENAGFNINYQFPFPIGAHLPKGGSSPLLLPPPSYLH